VRLTVGQLAAAAGMTVRNVRNHQSRGLLPPPELEARTAYYDERHLERLRLIRQMQAEGYNLEAIRRLLSGSELRQVATMPTEAPAALTAEDLVARGVSPEAALRVVAEVRESCEAMASAFVELFERELLGGGADPVKAVHDLRPVAARTVAALFDRAMAAEAQRRLTEPVRP
jgi:DNA-binding transcriptional MerR regulator